jgi:hypothetical protein
VKVGGVAAAAGRKCAPAAPIGRSLAAPQLHRQRGHSRAAGEQMKAIMYLLATLPLFGCIGGAPELTADQQSRAAKMTVYGPGQTPDKPYRVLEPISAADCAGAPGGGRVWGDAEKAVETLKEKAAALNADAVVNVRCGSAPLLNNCWAAQKCSGDAIVLQ